MTDTIFALATPEGYSGVAIIRVSGPLSLSILQDLTNISDWIPNYLTCASLKDKSDLIDQAMAVYFKAPHSFTGEDIVEFQVHGSRAVINRLFDVFNKYNNVRLAEPGEFTRRAFDNNKLDLTQVDGLSDLIYAETELQRQTALSQMDGGLTDQYILWRQELIHYLAYVEASVDFVDGEIDDDITQQVQKKLATFLDNLQNHLKSFEIGEKIHQGFRVALVGAPNAGKSTLINTLAKRDVAIVSDKAGTTRDVLEVSLNLKGIPVVLADMAGLHVTDDSIEQEGIKRARDWMSKADLQILLKTPDCLDVSLDSQCPHMIVWSKHDLYNELPEGLSLSCHQGKGVSELTDEIGHFFQSHIKPYQNATLVTRQRYVSILSNICQNINLALSLTDYELIAENLRLSVRAFDHILGRVDVESILDVIFGDFCIGK
jgi:tRNA modification GTPase